MYTNQQFLCGAAIFLSVVSCKQAGVTVDIEKERQALLAIYESEKSAHRNTDVNALMENTEENFIIASQGKIHSQSREEVRQFFEEYFRNAIYHEYDDLESPIVRVSTDGSMGWIISRLRARRTQTGDDGTQHEQEFIYAGIMLYEKQDGKWLRVANVSTFE